MRDQALNAPADADHLFIRNLDGSPHRDGAAAEPLIRFNNDPPADPAGDVDGEVADAPVASPIVVFGDAAPAANPQETVFS